MPLTSRQRVQIALAHQEPDRVPIDLGGHVVTGMHVSTVYRLRQALGLDRPDTPVKVIDSYQMLGEIGPDLAAALDVDVVNLPPYGTAFGFRNENWKPWRLHDGTPVLVPGAFNTDPAPNGDLYQYPQGDKSAPPSGLMPKGGWYFDIIVRQPPIDDDRLDPRDNLEEFGPISPQELEYLRKTAADLHDNTDKAVVTSFGGTSFGNIARVPGAQLRHPKGIRDIEEWYISQVTRRDYVYEVFDRQCQIGLANIEKVFAAVGNRITVIAVTGTDFGMQTGPLTSPAVYRDLYKPFHKRVNDWVHRHTGWKTFIHSCGSVRALIDDFIEAGFDILNPVQCSAACMDPAELKQEYGDRIVFWGGGVDTQRTLPFGTAADVEAEAARRVRTFGPGGGFVFAAIHNVQALSPVENVLAAYRTARKAGTYPLGGR